MIKEKEIELKLVLKLCEEHGYKACEFKDDGDNSKYEFFLVSQLERLNKIKFTHDQKQKIINQIIKNFGLSLFDFSCLLWGKISIEDKSGKLGIETKNALKFIDFENWNNNEFHVAIQVPVQFEEKRILDVVIFINGIPLIIIELKRKEIKIDKAISQLDNYKKVILNKGIFRFAQILVASNSVETKIWTNNQEDKRVMAFKWSKNGGGGSLSEFIKHFLEKNALRKYLEECVVFRNIDKKIILLRPYQKRAVEEVVTFVKEKLESGNLDINLNTNNGYVWHTTGSGKTVTSFKVAEVLSNDLRIDRVIFLLDRIDLSSQAAKEFSQMRKILVDDLDMFVSSNSKHLHNLLLKERFIVTTIQKMNWLLRKKVSKLKKIINLKFVFIIDECHRSQSGWMAKRIKNHFNNSIMIGFTGTPIFVSKSKKLQTENNFGVRIDVYNILNAMKEKNVLGFSIKDYLIKSNNGIFSDASTNYIQKIVEAIEKKHGDFTYNGKYKALFAFDNVAKMLKFYDYLSQIQEIFVTPIFSKLNDAKKCFVNEESENVEELELGEEVGEMNIEESTDVLYYKTKILKSYNKRFNTNFIPEDFNEYIEDVQNRFKKHDSGIDILMVVNMLLTGYDSKWINTLYVAKKLEAHNLLQAFSRTNRICDKSKTFGNIVNFSLNMKTIDEAISLYADKDMGEIQKYIYGKSYEEILEEFQIIWNAVLEWDAKNPYMLDVENINAENFHEHKELIQKFFRDVTALLKHYSELKTFLEHDDNKVKNFNKDKLIDKQEIFKKLQKKWKDQIKKEPELMDEFDDDGFEFNEYNEFNIDCYYILKLLSIKKLDEGLKEWNIRNQSEGIEKIEKYKRETLIMLDDHYKNQKIDFSDYEMYKNILENWYDGLLNLLEKRGSSEEFTIDELKDLKKKGLENIIKIQKNKSINRLIEKYPRLNNEDVRDDFNWRLEAKIEKLEGIRFINSYFQAYNDSDEIKGLKEEYLKILKRFWSIENVIIKIMGDRIA